MDNQINTFKFDGKPLTIIERDGEPWFSAAEVGEILELKGTNAEITKGLDEDEKGMISSHTLGGNQRTIYVSESGLYSLVLKSRKPEAKKFKKWVTSEVLPSIRKTGSYSTRPAPPAPVLPTAIEIAQWFIEAETGRQAAVAKVQELTPKAEALDRIAGTDGLHNLTIAGKLLGYDVLSVFVQALLDKGILYRAKRDGHLVATQEYIKRGWLQSKLVTYGENQGITKVTDQPMVTELGVTKLPAILPPPPPSKRKKPKPTPQQKPLLDTWGS